MDNKDKIIEKYREKAITYNLAFARIAKEVKECCDMLKNKTIPREVVLNKMEGLRNEVLKDYEGREE